jgi:hypothetical protein
MSHNSKYGKRDFSYYDGFFFKTPRLMEEFKGQFGVWDRMKEAWRRNTTNWIEMTYEEEASKFEGIPMKYLGNDAIDSDTEMYTHNIEHMFDRAVRNYIFKDELDDVFAINKAMQYMLMMKDENKHGETIKALERNLELTIRGRTQASPDSKDKSVFLAKNRSRFNWKKAILSLKNMAAYPLLTLNFIGGSLNGLMATILTVKDSLKNSMLKRSWFFTGMDGDHVDFTFRDLLGGFTA